MPIIIVGLVLSLLIWTVKDEHLRVYSILACFLFSSLYFFINLPNEYDLFRHYQYFVIVQKLSFPQLIHSTGILRTLWNETPGFAIYLWIISRFGVKELLPVISGMIIYYIPVYILNNEYQKGVYCRSAYNLSFAIVFLAMDFIGVSGIRNVLAFCVFILGFYFDVFKLHRKELCWIFYLVAASIHSAALILILLRLVLIFYSKATKIVMNIFVFIIIAIAPQFLSIAYDRFSNVPIISSGLWITIKYLNGFIESTDLAGMRYSCLILYIGVFLIVVNVLVINKSITFRQCYNYIILCFFFTIGSFGQYDTFVRMRFLFAPFLAILFLDYFHSITGGKRLVIQGSNMGATLINMIIFLAFIASVIITIVYRFIYQYYPLTQYFGINI